MNPTEAIQNMIDELLKGSDIFLVSFKVKPTNNYKIFLDSDSGFNLEKCIKINRQLRNQIDEAGFYPDGNYSLEVSSPGVDEPLVLIRQYLKNINRLVEVQFNDEEQKSIIGRLKTVEDEKIIIEIEDKKKKTQTEHNIDFSNIKTTTVQIEF